MKNRIDIPSDIDPGSPEFMQALNDRLRRIAGAAGASVTNQVSTPSSGSAATPASVLSFWVNDTLAIESDAAPAVYLHSSRRAAAVKAYVKSAPTGADLQFTIYAGATAWMPLTITAGSTSVAASADDINGASDLPADTEIRLAITAVGTTFPGADLSVFVYF